MLCLNLHNYSNTKTILKIPTLFGQAICELYHMYHSNFRLSVFPLPLEETVILACNTGACRSLLFHFALSLNKPLAIMGSLFLESTQLAPLSNGAWSLHFWDWLVLGSQRAVWMPPPLFLLSQVIRCSQNELFSISLWSYLSLTLPGACICLEWLQNKHHEGKILIWALHYPWSSFWINKQVSTWKVWLIFCRGLAAFPSKWALVFGGTGVHAWVSKTSSVHLVNMEMKQWELIG